MKLAFEFLISIPGRDVKQRVKVGRLGAEWEETQVSLL